MRNTLPLSSFPLQILLQFETYYQPILSITFFFILLYKTFNLPYTTSMMAQEGIIQFIYFVGMMLRIQGGKSANKTENSHWMVGFIFGTIAGIVLGVYFIVIQYYVLLIQIIMVVIMLLSNAFEALFGFFSCWQFQSYEKQQ